MEHRRDTAKWQRGRGLEIFQTSPTLISETIFKDDNDQFRISEDAIKLPPSIVASGRLKTYES